MKKIFNIIFLILLTVACSKTELFLDAPPVPIQVGSSFNIDVRIYNLRYTYNVPDIPWYWVISPSQRYTTVNDLYGVGFDLWYDSAIIGFQSMDITSGFLSGAQIVNSFRNSQQGKLVIGISLEGSVPGISGSGKFLTLTFTALAPGTSTIHLHDLHIYDSNGNKIDSSVIINNSNIIVQ